MKKLVQIFLIVIFILFLISIKMKEDTVLDNASEKIEDKLFIIRYSPKDEDTAILIKKYLNKYFIDLLKKFDFLPEYKLVFTIHADKSSFEYKTYEKYHNIYAAYIDGQIHFLNQESLSEDEIESTVIHELVHYIVDEKSDSNASAFLSEGLAYYFEYLYLDKFMDDESFKLLSNEELYYNFNDYNSFNFDDLKYSSYIVLRDLILNEGQDKINLILTELKKEKDFLKVYKNVIGEDFLI